MERRRVLFITLIISTLSLCFINANNPEDEDDSLPGTAGGEDSNNDGDTWNIPGGGMGNLDGPGDDLDPLSDNLEDSLDSMLEEPGMGGVLNMFKNLGQIISKLKRSQNGNVNRGMPRRLANNPCFSNNDKMQDLNEEVSELITEQQSSSETDSDGEQDSEEEASEMIEKISAASLECFTPMLNNHTKVHMCRKFAKKSVNGFQKLLSAGLDCVEALSFNITDDDDDDDDDLDLPHQMLIMKHMKRRPVNSWSRADINRALQLAPDTLDDDVIEGLSDDVFEDSLEEMGRMVMRNRGNPAMQAALRRRISKWRAPGTMTAADITQIGAGLAALDIDDLDDIDPESLSEADLDGVDLDFDDDDPRGLALGRLMRQGQQRSPSQFTRNDIKKMFRFVRNDPEFIRNLNVDTLVESLSDIADIELDDDEARPMCRKIRESPDWDDDSDLSVSKLMQLKPVMKGCGRDFFSALSSDMVEQALDSFNDLDLDESEADTLLRKLNIGNFKSMTTARFRQIGRLAKALDADDIDDLPDNVVTETLDDINDMDMDDWKRKKFVYKAIMGNRNRLPVKVLGLQQFANTLSVDDLESLDVADLKMNIAQAGRINWRSSLASAVYHKLRSADHNLKVDDLTELGSLVTGMSEEDINNIPVERAQVLSLAAVLSDHQDDLSQSQTEAVVDKLEEVFDFERERVSMDENEVIQAAPFLQYLPQNLFNKIRLSEPAREAFLTAMNRGSKSRISRQQLQYLTEQGTKMLGNGEYQMTERETDWDDQKVARMSGLVAGMPANVIRRLPGPAVVRNLQGFTKEPLSDDQGEAVMKKVMEHDSGWHCKRERLAQVGPFLKHLSEDKLKTICKSEMAAAASAVMKGINGDEEKREERRRQGLLREEVTSSSSQEGEERVVNFIQQSMSSDSSVTRRRRAVAGPTCDEIKTMGKKAFLLKVTSLQIIDTKVEFPNCLETLGSISNWNKEQLKVLHAKTVEVYGSHDTWSSDVVRQAGSILAALGTNQINTIKLTTLDAIASAGKHAIFSHAQLRAGFYRWLNQTKTNDITKVVASELASLGHFVCGPEPAHILLISQTAFKGALNVIGKAFMCDSNQLQAYAAKAIETYGGNVASWIEPVVADIGIIIGGLQASQIRMLTPKQISVISTTIIPYLAPGVLRTFTTTQLGRFNTNQANAITQPQYEQLSAAKQDVISEKATITFQRSSSENAAPVSQATLFSILLVITCNILLLF